MEVRCTLGEASGARADVALQATRMPGLGLMSNRMRAPGRSRLSAPCANFGGSNTGQLPRAIPRECWLTAARFAFGSSDKSAIHVTNEELAVGRMLPCDSGLLK